MIQFICMCILLAIIFVGIPGLIIYERWCDREDKKAAERLVWCIQQRAERGEPYRPMIVGAGPTWYPGQAWEKKIHDAHAQSLQED